MNENTTRYLLGLDGITECEWKRLRSIVDKIFWQKAYEQSKQTKFYFAEELTSRVMDDHGIDTQQK